MSKLLIASNGVGKIVVNIFFLFFVYTLILKDNYLDLYIQFRKYVLDLFTLSQVTVSRGCCLATYHCAHLSFKLPIFASKYIPLSISTSQHEADKSKMLNYSYLLL